MTTGGSGTEAEQSNPLDASVPHAPRIWNYWLGGKDNFAADREVGQQIARFFDNLDLLEPGVVSCTRWRPDPADAGSERDVDEFCGVARKP